MSIYVGECLNLLVTKLYKTVLIKIVSTHYSLTIPVFCFF